ncbi:hypothetical protein VNO77_23928 [Canavalia gladiata]|uniref:Uncharacterized protein n=1 Tax=Canavalia gladiata TaxID=3824 RepID=A0AAN9QC00_CANGL
MLSSDLLDCFIISLCMYLPHSPKVACLLQLINMVLPLHLIQIMLVITSIVFSSSRISFFLNFPMAVFRHLKRVVLVLGGPNKWYSD